MTPFGRQAGFDQNQEHLSPRTTSSWPCRFDPSRRGQIRRDIWSLRAACKDAKAATREEGFLCTLLVQSSIFSARLRDEIAKNCRAPWKEISSPATCSVTRARRPCQPSLKCAGSIIPETLRGFAAFFRHGNHSHAWLRVGIATALFELSLLGLVSFRFACLDGRTSLSARGLRFGCEI